MDERNKDNVLGDFTKREAEIVSYIIKGLTNKGIAKELYLTETTVKSYVTNILSKTGFKNRREIMIYFINHEKIPTKGGTNS